MALSLNAWETRHHILSLVEIFHKLSQCKRFSGFCGLNRCRCVARTISVSHRYSKQSVTFVLALIFLAVFSSLAKYMVALPWALHEKVNIHSRFTCNILKGYAFSFQEVLASIMFSSKILGITFSVTFRIVCV